MAQKYIPMLKREIKQNKQGIIGGGIVGAAIAAYLQNEGVTAIMAAGTTGIVDVVAPTVAPLTLAVVKFYLASILIFMAIGYVVDKYSKWI